MITVPFFTELTAGCTGVLSEVETVALEPETVVFFIVPTIFAGIAKVVVLVTSPLAFVITPGRALGDEDGLGAREGVGEIKAGLVAIGVGALVTTGNCEIEGKGVGKKVGVTEGEGEGVPNAATAGGINMLPPPPPKNPPPLDPPDGGAVITVGVGVGVGVGLGEGGGADALGVADVVALGAAVGVALALAEAPKVSCPEIGERTLSPTAFVA